MTLKTRLAALQRRLAEVARPSVPPTVIVGGLEDHVDASLDWHCAGPDETPREAAARLGLQPDGPAVYLELTPKKESEK
mgnify:CR=1 FL=1